MNAVTSMRGSYHKWSSEEDGLLARLSMRGADEQEFADAFPGVSQSAIYQRRRALGLVSKRKRWSDYEDALLKQLWGAPLEQLHAIFPHRSPMALRQRGIALGLGSCAQKKARWTVLEDDFVRKNYPIHDSKWDGWLKNLGARSWDSIRQRASKLGVYRGESITFSSAQKRELASLINELSHAMDCTHIEVTREMYRLAKSGLVDKYA